MFVSVVFSNSADLVVVIPNSSVALFASDTFIVQSIFNFSHLSCSCIYPQKQKKLLLKAIISNRHNLLQLQLADFEKISLNLSSKTAKKNLGFRLKFRSLLIINGSYVYTLVLV